MRNGFGRQNCLRSDIHLPCFGPNLVPALNEVPISIGIPIKHASKVCKSFSDVAGNLINVPNVSAVQPALGIAFPERGSFNFDDVDKKGILL